MSLIKPESSGNIVTATTSPYSPVPANNIFQVPNMNSTGTNIATTTSIIRNNNVSVTNIKCEVDDIRTMAAATAAALSVSPISVNSNNGNIVPVVNPLTSAFFNGRTGGGIRIPVPKTEHDSDSETELSNIENLKVTRRSSASSSTMSGGFGGGVDGGGGVNLATRNGPRPMSWEGELSEHENDIMETENSVSNDKQYLLAPTVIKSETGSSLDALSMKSEMDPISVEINSSLFSQSAKVKIDQHLHNHQLHHNQQQQQQQLHQQQQQHHLPQSDPINLKFDPGMDASLSASTGGGGISSSGLNSPLLTSSRSTKNNLLPANPSPDSAIHSIYTHSSPSQSPLTSRHAPYTPSLSRNNSDASHSSCYSYSSEFSPTHSPIQARHNSCYGNFNGSLHHSVLYRPIIDGSSAAGAAVNGSTVIVAAGAQVTSLSSSSSSSSRDDPQNLSITNGNSQTIQQHQHQQQTTAAATTNTAAATPLHHHQQQHQNKEELILESDTITSPGISRQQLINSPCPICGDKISGFHYGIFSCESCKGFFKRTVQNRKNYVCVRGGPCPVVISTRKKCPACRFEKCLQKGMKLEAIREDRTRGGRSTYQCSYTFPNPMLSPEQQQKAISISTGAPATAAASATHVPTTHGQHQQRLLGSNGLHIKTEQLDSYSGTASTAHRVNNIPSLLQEIMDVEHLWQYNEAELSRLNQPLSTSSGGASNSSSSSSSSSSTTPSHEQQSNPMTNHLLASAGLTSNSENANPDLIANLCNVADHRLYKIVKWCKSLPLFKNISIDDQICLLINSWCELLLFSCCFRSIETPGEIKISRGKSMTLSQAKSNSLQSCIERMLNLTDHLRRLRVDRYEYVAMKVIMLLQSDTSELQEPVKVRECQEKALQSLQAYTIAHYPGTPSKFGELLLRIPELQRTCQLGKDTITMRSRDGGDFNLLMELLRGEH